MEHKYKKLLQIKITLNNLEPLITYGLRESYGIYQALSNVEELIIAYKKERKASKKNKKKPRKPRTKTAGLGSSFYAKKIFTLKELNLKHSKKKVK
jgi:hypothetical protein|tara:strand:+ start:280 stop:567 length:288 start_codon:yes stop_codon:yes gene_type:complete